MSGQTKVLYIAGSGRSCTNLLGHILGQAPGFCFVGEAMYGGQSLASRRCGCGARVADCDFWTAVRRAVGGGERPVEAEEFFGLGRLARWRHLPGTFFPGRDRRLESRYGAHWQGCQRLYETIAARSGAEIVVDSSKAVPYARLLGLMPGLDLHVVHLVRDARAVAHSRKRLKPAPDRYDSAHMRQRGCGQTALFWSVSNLGIELFRRRRPGRYLRLRYEDFVRRPRESVDGILRAVTNRPVEAPFVGESTVDLRSTHSVSGNPDRLQTGRVELRPDLEWRSAMAPRDRRLVTALTWPLLLRYGYLGESR